VVVVARGLALGAAPATAHAQLLSTEPANGQVLDTAPEQVILRFNEAVDPPGDAIEVYNSSGDKLDAGKPERPGGDSAAVAVDLPDLDDGAYVVTWRVSSADSHPIRGGFTFRVGSAGGAGDNADAEALMEKLVAGKGGDSTVGVVYGGARFAAFVGMILLVGGAVFLWLLWPAGTDDRRARRLLGAGWLSVTAATVLSFGLLAAYTEGESLGGAFDTSSIADVIGTRAGRVWLVRLALLACVAVGRRWLLPTAATAGTETTVAERARWAVVPAVIGVALLATISLAGHAGTGDVVPLALPADVVHLAAASFWLGGLAFLLMAVLRAPVDPRSDDDRQLAPVVRGFSTGAAVAVGALAVTGTIQAIRQTQGFEALFDTTYGRVLIVKVLLVAATVGVGALSRSWVRRRWPTSAQATVSPGPGAKAVDEVKVAKAAAQPAPSAPPVSALRRTVGVEVALATVVLAVTSLLVNTVPGREAVSPTFSAELHGETLLVRVEIDPAKAGTTDVRIETLSHLGEPRAVEEVTATLSLPDRDIGPIPLVLEPDGSAVGRYIAADAEIPFPGTWQLDVNARTSEFEESQVTTQVAVK
jgi:copper transport protein